VTDRIGTARDAAIILANPAALPRRRHARRPRPPPTLANNLPGELREIRTVLGNYGSTRRPRASTSPPSTGSAPARFGRFTTRAVASLINSQTLRTRPDLAQVETVGLYEIPRWRGDASLLWTRQKASAAVNVNYIGGFQDTSPSALFVKQQFTTDVQFSHALPWGLRGHPRREQRLRSPPPRHELLDRLRRAREQLPAALGLPVRGKEILDTSGTRARRAPSLSSRQIHAARSLARGEPRL
jgi:hypothetical protein